jgi:hypothetical protein
MSKAALLQAKVANLPEPIATEVLDFLEFVTSRRQFESRRSTEAIQQFRGAFKGRISSADEFAANKANEIGLEQ